MATFLTESERLQRIMQEEQMSSRQFADEVGIQAGTLSNIMKGRNKPSLEVLQKVLNRFRTISSDWLILGVGAMYRQKNDSQQPVLFDIPPENSGESNDYIAQQTENLQQSFALKQKKTTPEIIEKPVYRKVKKVVIFFDDGTFQEIEQ